MSISYIMNHILILVTIVKDGHSQRNEHSHRDGHRPQRMNGQQSSHTHSYPHDASELATDDHPGTSGEPLSRFPRYGYERILNHPRLKCCLIC